MDKEKLAKLFEMMCPDFIIENGIPIEKLDNVHWLYDLIVAVSVSGKTISFLKRYSPEENEWGLCGNDYLPQALLHFTHFLPVR